MFEGLNCRRREPDFIERGLALAAPGEFQVAIVDGIEAAAKDAEAHEWGWGFGTGATHPHPITYIRDAPNPTATFSMSANQQSLFDTEPPPWELDDAAQQMVATVVLSSGPVGDFDYLVPEELMVAGGESPAVSSRHLQVGCRVRVPLGRGNRSVVGYCVALGYKPAGGRKLKAVAQVLDRQPLVSPAILRLTQWMADYYLCSWGQVLEAVVPAGVRHQAGTRDVKLLSVSAAVVAQIEELKLVGEAGGGAAAARGQPERRSRRSNLRPREVHRWPDQCTAQERANCGDGRAVAGWRAGRGSHRARAAA